MSLNWREIDCILQELDLEGSLVREVHQPTHDSIVFELYSRQKRLKLYFSFSNQYYRLHALTRTLKNPAKPPRFALFLRANVRGGKIVQAGQLGAERIVRMVVNKAGRETVLWARLWGGAVNMIATDTHGRILDAFYRRPKRGEISGGHYDPTTTLGQGKRKTDSYRVRELTGEGETFNSKIEAFYFAREQQHAREQLSSRVERELQRREVRTLTLLDKLRRKLSEYGEYPRYRQIGDLIMSWAHTVQKGDKWLVVQDQEGTEEVQIALKTGLTPFENAQVYYQMYRKAKSGLTSVQSEIAQGERALEGLRNEQLRIQDCDSLEGLRQVTDSLFDKQPSQTAGVPGLSYSSGTWRILVGRNSSDNDELLRRYVKGNDYWFHARDHAGAYVFVVSQPGKSMPLEVMIDAATCAIYYSKANQSGKGDVYYTQVKHLRRIKGGRRGLVTPLHEKNLFIRLDSSRIARLKDRAASTNT